MNSIPHSSGNNRQNDAPRCAALPSRKLDAAPRLRRSGLRWLGGWPVALPALWLILLGPCQGHSQNLALSVRPSATQSPAFQPLLFDIQTDASFPNPFDPDEVALDALVQLPDRTSLTLPCFYVGPNDHGTLWQGRFTPRQPGPHQVRVRLKTRDRIGQSDLFTVQVSASRQDGFLNLDPRHHDVLLFDSGRPFRGLGINLGWEPQGPNRNVPHSYETMLSLLQTNGGNFIRTWMCPWNLPLEWKRLGPGRYDPETARRLDELLDLARAHGIYVMLCLDYHGVLRTTPDVWGGNDQWKNHPYNQANGGPCAQPADLFTHPEARRLYRNRLRYLVARWGYHPHLAVWEFWNEIDIPHDSESIPQETIVAWHREMAAHLKSIDPFHHLVSTSLSHGDWPALWQLPDLDFTMTHFYQETSSLPEFIRGHVDRYDKPFVTGEFAFSWKSPGQIGQPENYARELHLGLWRGLMSVTPILPMTWWWEHHADRGELTHLRAVRRFSDRLLAARQTPWQTRPVQPSTGLETMALKAGNHCFLWAHNPTDQPLGNPRVGLPDTPSEAPFLTTFSPDTAQFDTPIQTPLINHSLTLPDLRPGQDLALVLQPPEPDLTGWARLLERQLRESVLPYWLEATVDANHGGYLLADDLAGPLEARQKQLVGQSRMIWGFAHAHLQGWSSQQHNYLQAAEQGYRFLLRHFHDREHGGYFWTTDLQGRPLDQRKIVYGQSFVIYGLVEYYRASRDRQALQHALDLYQTLQEKTHDAEHGGWIEHFEPDWQPILSPDAPAQVEIAGLKSANTHLHLMEAFAELYEATRRPDVKRSLEEALRLNQTWFYPPDPAQAAFHRHPDGRRATGPRSDGLSYGHNIEFAWLMVRAQRVLGQPVDWDHFNAHVDHGLRYGFDHERGGMYNKGYDNQPASDTEKVWWVQAECVAALTDALLHQNDPARNRALRQTLAFVRDHMTDPRDHVWIASVTKEGEPKWTSKASDWKANYHDVRALVKFCTGFAPPPPR